MKKYCVLLSGCGHRDGSEIYEAVFSLLALSQHDIEYDIFAPNRQQYDTLNHLTGEEINPKRNILQESARIARGYIKPLEDFDITNYSALILPGGYGALKNFTNFPAEDGNWQVKSDVKNIILAFHKSKKPIGAICIFPSILAILFNDKKIQVTTGLNPESKKLIDFTQAQVHLIDSDEIVVDRENLIISTPAFMNDASLTKVFKGINKLITEITRLVQ